jgi:SAM-dependent methyltransferase
MRLTNRPRIRQLIERGVDRALAVVPHQPQHQPPHAIDAAVSAHAEPPLEHQELENEQSQLNDLAREFQPAALAVDGSTVSDLLYARLRPEDIAETEQRIREGHDLPWDYATAPTESIRRFLALTYGMWLGVEGVGKSTGLTAAHPPEDVHAMTRGPLAAAGGLYEADLIVNSLASAGVEMAQVRQALDFGCSSGRVVRVLAAAYREIEWHGCDPNAPAIGWASENLLEIDFFVSDDAPPLPLADGSLDLVYAISIWSHFEPALGLRWFEEMRRVIRPGGHLVCTTHGLVSVGFYATRRLRSPEQSREIADALYRQGWWYAPEFGDKGDWGVVNPEWGTAFLSPEWMLTKLCPQWRVLEFAPGRNQENQDVYVLQRV